jgi:hypothetical protein
MKKAPISKKQSMKKWMVAVVVFVVFFTVYWFLLGGNPATYEVQTCVEHSCSEPYLENFSFTGELLIGVVFASIGLALSYLIIVIYNFLRKKAKKS